MHTTNERVRLVKQRANVLQKKRESHWLGITGTLCIVLTATLVTAIATIADTTGIGMVPELYGSILRFDGAGGYVLVGVLAFVAAVEVTVLCMRYKAKKNKINLDNPEDKR